ncbi:hypothetical protein NicSoilC5_03470 [Arthrobacter sp. NicSoilC5]|nr:hypothetical protein NicSoilC5_03470 [Arthrobacter sp. NicSoilC5]
MVVGDDGRRWTGFRPDLKGTEQHTNAITLVVRPCIYPAIMSSKQPKPRSIETTACAYCGKEFQWERVGGATVRKYCSAPCRSKFNAEKSGVRPRNRNRVRQEPREDTVTCLQCGIEFDYQVMGRGRVPQICSPECKAARRKALKEEKRQDCPTCDVEGCEKKSRSSGTKSGIRLCEMHYGRTRTNGTIDRIMRDYTRICHYCGGPAPKQRLFCSDVCRRRDRLGAPDRILVCIACLGDIPEEKRLDTQFCSPKCYRIVERGKSYGLTPREAYQLLGTPRLCDLCEEQQATHIDHNHDTGKVRGVLCTTCNAGLGMFQDSARLLGKGVTYLEKNGSYGLEWHDTEADASEGLAAAS